MSVRQLQQEIASDEIVEWMAYFNLEPWGTDVENYRWGLFMSIFANCHRDAKKQPTPFRPADFLPTAFDEPQKKEDLKPEDRKQNQLLIANMLKAAFGGELIDGEPSRS